jgi:hypothetical protein
MASPQDQQVPQQSTTTTTAAGQLSSSTPPAIAPNDPSSISSTSVPPIKLKQPFPEWFKSSEDKQFAKFLEMIQDAQITIPILDVVLHVLLYTKFFKELLTKK